MKRFHDITSRNEAARFLQLLVKHQYLNDIDGSSLSNLLILAYTKGTGSLYELRAPRNTAPGIPLEICYICKQFASLLSFQAKVTLSCGHTFHRSCLAELSTYEMGRCSECDAEISTIKTKSELDLITPFISKILSSPQYPFFTKIEEFAFAFHKKFGPTLLVEVCFLLYCIQSHEIGECSVSP